MWIILVAAVAAAAGLWLGQRALAPAPTSLEAGLAYPQPRALPDFALTRADGSELRADALRGRWSLVFFGFTHCPDVCPTTLASYREIERALEAQDPVPPYELVFVSLDPERDAGKPLADYAAYFSARILAVTGTREQLDALTRALGILYAKSPTGGSDYTIDHSTQLVLLDPDVRMAAIFRPPLDAARIARDIGKLASAR